MALSQKQREGADNLSMCKCTLSGPQSTYRQCDMCALFGHLADCESLLKLMATEMGVALGEGTGTFGSIGPAIAIPWLNSIRAILPRE